MALVSRSVDYAFRAVVFLARRFEERRYFTLTEIVERYPVSASQMAKVLQTLARAGVVRSMKGQTGGFRLARAPAEITLLDVIESVDGALRIFECEGDALTCMGPAGCLFKSACAEAGSTLNELFRQVTLDRCLPTA